MALRYQNVADACVTDGPFAEPVALGRIGGLAGTHDRQRPLVGVERCRGLSALDPRIGHHEVGRVCVTVPVARAGVGHQTGHDASDGIGDSLSGTEAEDASGARENTPEKIATDLIAVLRAPGLRIQPG